MPRIGTVFQLVPEGGNHFWVVISAPLNGLVLAINITDASHSPDSPCKIAPGEHPRIYKDSVAYYRKAREFEAARIDELLKNPQMLRQLEDCSPELLNRIIAGARVADDLTFRFLDYLPPQ
jgi:hypothetical protein